MQVKLAPLLDEEVGAPICAPGVVAAFKRFLHVLVGVCHGEQESNDEHG